MPPSPTTQPPGAHWRIAGSPSLRPVLQGLIHAFGQTHPRHAITLELAGASVGIARLIHGEALLSAQTCEISDEETVPYRKGVGERPCAVRIAHADPVAPLGHSRALALYVHAGNPATGLSLRDVARIFSTGHPDGDCRRWGQAGLNQDDWPQRLIRPLVREEGSPLGTYLRRHVFDGRPHSPSCEQHGSARAILARLAAEPSGIAIAPAGCRLPDVRPLPLARHNDGPYRACEAQAIVDGSYPLDPGLLLYVRRDADGGVHPWARDFCLSALSSRGQQAIRAAQAGYLPLAPASADAERSRLPGAAAAGAPANTDQEMT
ncbi:hypothetical protein D8I35_10745 [Corticibacter populi]|uniref:PBP domain-containing protein n=1 Tax=Corticibacter populi TaxID=1550736 RepID=A0A3M6QRR7_9BURK|nr:substrate-binding domain-containing protein [Corticibacter populi]RMX05663.1 hypothetical protein D8I35_10745 [Corticibacter populi]RZS31055.1 phosphate ABC transporter substrate-binding protein (PhoT family) [Corticibacter populi]